MIRRSMVATALASAVFLTAGDVSDASSGHVYLNIAPYAPKPNVDYQPSRLDEITGDGTAYVTAIRWRRWNQPQAYGTGVAHLDNCEPDCAEGTFSAKSTHLHAYRVRYRHAAHRDVYTRLTIKGLHIGGSPVLVLSHNC